MKVYYYRCNCCLSVATVQAEKSGHHNCSICKEPMEEMGHVFDAKLVKEELRSVCDERCTRASGPSCDCKCGGVNHGTGLMTIVNVVQGEIPEITINDGMAYFRRKQYLLALEQCSARMANYIQSVPVEKRDYWFVSRAKEQFNKAKNNKVHSLRLKALRSLFL